MKCFEKKDFSAGLSLLREPVKSSLDHIRIPAVYAIVDIASSTSDPAVDQDALDALSEPIKSGQIAPRLVVVDAINLIVNGSESPNELVQTALRLLCEPADSGTDAVRMPTVNSIVRLVEGSGDEVAPPLNRLEVLTRWTQYGPMELVGAQKASP